MPLTLTLTLTRTQTRTRARGQTAAPALSLSRTLKRIGGQQKSSCPAATIEATVPSVPPAPRIAGASRLRQPWPPCPRQPGLKQQCSVPLFSRAGALVPMVFEKAPSSARGTWLALGLGLGLRLGSGWGSGGTA